MGPESKRPPTTKISSKGQTTIPKPVRDELGLGEGDVVLWTVREGKAELRKAVGPVDDFDELAARIAEHFEERGLTAAEVKEAIRRTRRDEPEIGASGEGGRASMQNVELRDIDAGVIQQVRDRIVEACRPRRIYLFGSAASGEAGPESDLDLLVVTELEEGKRPHEKAGEIRRLFDGWLVGFDIVVQTPEEFARTRNRPGHIATTAARTGKLLYRADESDG